MEIEKASEGARRGPYVRRSPELKAAIVPECLVPGASVAAVALAHGVNANLVRKWIEKSRPSTQAETDVSWLAVVTILAALALLDARKVMRWLPTSPTFSATTSLARSPAP